MGCRLAAAQVAVTYAFKKESKGERHGTPAERLLAAQMKAKQVGACKLMVEALPFATACPLHLTWPCRPLPAGPTQCLQQHLAGRRGPWCVVLHWGCLQPER
jgi:hypothetical protein